MSQTVYVVSRKHFDNTWRRCWDRPYEYRGQSYASYVAVEAACIDLDLANAADGQYAFEIESSRLLRRYIQDHPGSLELFAKLWQEGRFCLLGSGEVIPDSNMPRGETLARNMAEGVWWSQEALGHRPSVGWCCDGFGSCAQLPQIFAGCGLNWIASLSYKFPSKEYWRGLDGSVVYIGNPPKWNHCDFVKYPACPKCNGHGCQACGGYGLDFIRVLKPDPWWDRLEGPVGLITYNGEEILPPVGLTEAMREHNAAQPAGGVIHRFGTHESLLEHLKDKLAACDNPPAESLSPEVDGNPTGSGVLVGRIELKRRLRSSEMALAAAEAWSALSGAAASQVPADLPRVQKSADDSALAGRILPWEAHGHGGGAVPTLRDLWRDLAFVCFHDAITATHIDSAYRELLDVYDHIEDACAAHLRAAPAASALPAASTAKPPAVRMHLFNATAKRGGVREIWPVGPLPDGPVVLRHGGRELPVIERIASPEGTPRLWAELPDMPPGASLDVEVVAAPAQPAAEAPWPPGQERLGWEGRRLAVEACPTGLLEVRCDGRTVLRRGAWGVGEVIIEHDTGDPWATRYFERPRRGLSSAAQPVAFRQTASWCEFEFAGDDPDSRSNWTSPDSALSQFQWSQRWRFYREFPYFDLRTEITWSAYNRRVRLAFPTGWPTNDLWTEVPFGVLPRARYEMTSAVGLSANGDWPAINWGGVEHAGRGLAVVNRGTPSYRCEDGTVLVSVLRSPGLPFCLEEPTSYSAPDYEGMRDPGRHVFLHRILPYTGGWAQAGVVDLAEAFVAPAILAPGPGVSTAVEGVPPGVSVAAIKHPYVYLGGTQDAIVIRLAEMTGQPQRFSLRLAGKQIRSAELANLLEDTLSPATVSSGAVELEMRRWQVLTVKVQLA